MKSNVEEMMMTFQEVYAKLERVFCAELVHGGWCIFKTEKHIILEKSAQGQKLVTDSSVDETRSSEPTLSEVEEEKVVCNLVDEGE